MLASASRVSAIVEPLLCTGVRGAKGGSKFFSGSDGVRSRPGDSPIVPRLCTRGKDWACFQLCHVDSNSTKGVTGAATMPTRVTLSNIG